MATARETYNTLKERAKLEFQDKGKVDGKLMRDKAQAYNEVRNEERAANRKAGEVMNRRTGQPITNPETGEAIRRPDKRSLQEAYVRTLPDKAQGQARARLGLDK
jgi:hypothetical protein